MLIDFEEKLREFLTEYKHENDIEDEELEEMAPELYLDWIDSPKEWLSGLSPKNYFKDYDAAALVQTLGEYIFSDTALPGGTIKPDRRHQGRNVSAFACAAEEL